MLYVAYYSYALGGVLSSQVQGRGSIELSVVVQDELLASIVLLREYGPTLGRPEVDTLNDSKYANMKELRFRANGGVWRVAFAFDPQRNAILLVAGDKSGVSERKFYKRLIEKADKRYKEYLDNL
jgi:hypothetical protein